MSRDGNELSNCPGKQRAGAHPGQWGTKPVENYGWTADWGHSKARDPKEEETWEIQKSGRREPCPEAEETCSYTLRAEVKKRGWVQTHSKHRNSRVSISLFRAQGRETTGCDINDCKARGGPYWHRPSDTACRKCFLTTQCLKSQWNICARRHGAEN